MFDVLKTLSGLVKTKKTVVKGRESNSGLYSAPQQAPKPKVAVMPSVDVDASLRIAQAQAKEVILEAKDEALRIRRDSEEEIRRKLEGIVRREGSLEDQERRAKEIQLEVEKRLAEIEESKKAQIEKLELIAHLTREEAKVAILGELQEKLKEDVAKEIREAIDQAHEEAELKAREILVDAMRHGATNYVSEYTVSIIKITDEEMKGRIIGKEGRNIRAFETATGVDVDLDEEGIIRLSCFDPV